jgi:hypothetical protein
LDIILHDVCRFANPGQLKMLKTRVDIEQGIPYAAAGSQVMAISAPHPFRRYDHFCKWLNSLNGYHNDANSRKASGQADSQPIQYWP